MSANTKTANTKTANTKTANTKTFTRAILSGSALFTLLTIPALAGDFTHTFDVDKGAELVVDTDLGSIEIKTAKINQVEVLVEVSGPNVDDFEVEYSGNGKRPTIRGDHKRGRSWFGNIRSPKVRFLITVPSKFDLNLKTSGGSIEVDDLQGEVLARTSGGRLEFGEITGQVQGNTSGGSISLRGAVGDVELKTSGGSIHVGDVNGNVKAHTSGGSIRVDNVQGEVDASTSGGAIHLDEVSGTVLAKSSGGPVSAYISDQPGDDCRLTTSGGSVTVHLASHVGVDLDAYSSGSRPSSDFDLDGGTKSRNSLSGKINGGGPKLQLKSSGGRVRVLEKR